VIYLFVVRGSCLELNSDLQRDAWLIELAQQAAERLLAEHGDLVERHLERWLGSRAEFLKA
jgi:ATP-dependent DNA helicase RecG